jgi:peptidoglycan/LPS O-acetylase OafA/YrhL
LRIIRALTVDTIFCAIILGPIITTYSVGAYFSNKEFAVYLLNAVGDVHFLLPGVFTHHPLPFVNGALWTVPCELSCYLIMSFFIVTGWIKRPAFVAISTVVFLFTGLIAEHFFLHHSGPRASYVFRALDYLIVTHRGQVVLAFMMGIVAYQLRYFIPYSWILFYICCAITLFAMFYLHTPDISKVGNRIFFLPPLIYMTAFLGLTNIKIPKFLHRGDYSYGIYLYHYPLLQVIVGLVPATVAIRGGGSVILFVIGLPVVFAFAWASWHFVEKPILGLRKRFSFVARVRGVEDAPAPVGGDAGPATTKAFSQP